MNRKPISIAKSLRKMSTDAEKCLWQYLQNKQLIGLKSRRQQPIGQYIVDFVCFERCILIEVDGGQHAEEREKDIERDNWLRGQGFRVLRFWNNEVLKNINGVIEVIIKESLYHPPPTPSHQGRGRIKGGARGNLTYTLDDDRKEHL